MRYERYGRFFGILLLLLVLLAGSALGEEIDESFALRNGILTVAAGVTEMGYPWIENEETYDFDSFPSLEANNYILSQIRLPTTLRKLHGFSFAIVRGVDTLVLPEGLEEVHTPFYMCGFRRIVFPSTLRVFDGLNDSYADDLAYLEEIDVAPDNPYFTSVDGVLFTADMKTLLYYPAAKQGAHYDVPKGVETIGSYAFWGNLNLQSVSLPMGLMEIERSAFANCHSLTSVSLPLTLRSIGECAFLRSRFLKEAVVPPHTAVDETAFEECPAISGSEEGSSEKANEPSDKTSVAPDGLTTSKTPSVYALLSPENARELVAILERPEKSAAVVATCQSGSSVEVVGEEKGYYAIKFDSNEDVFSGYVPMEQVTLAAPYQGLFRIASASLRRDGVYGYEDAYTLPVEESCGKPFSRDTLLQPWENFHGQWLPCDYGGTYGLYCAYFSPADLILTREHTGDSRTFGLVVNPDPRDRLHLRAEPKRGSESLGKFYTGTQVEILDETGDWYHVRVGFDEGYMMREFVTIIEQEEIDP